MLNKKIYVTQPDLPDLDEFIVSLKKIWKTKRVTNIGEFHQKFEKELADFLGVKYVSLFANGTLALISALHVLKISGEVITTPYTFVATTHALWWNGIKPVFVDIDTKTNTLDPDKIEAAITPKTTAILPVHIYGNPCSVGEIQKISDVYNLKVIYDAAHAFGVKINENSVLNYGDLSILSFHATKSFTTIEGGAIVCHDKKTKKQIDYLRNFGFTGETNVIRPGLNAKMNEIQSAFGLLQLKTFNDNIKKRKNITFYYRERLKNIYGLKFYEDINGVEHNYSFFPVFIDENFPISRDELYFQLQKNNIYGRRYFFPLISKFSPYKRLESSASKNLPVAEIVANQVICLPIYPNLDFKTIDKICSIISAFSR